MILPKILSLFIKKRKVDYISEGNKKSDKKSIFQKEKLKKELETILAILVNNLSKLNSDEVKTDLKFGITPEFITNFCSELNIWYQKNKEFLSKDSQKLFKNNIRVCNPEEGISVDIINKKLTNLIKEINILLNN